MKYFLLFVFVLLLSLLVSACVPIASPTPAATPNTNNPDTQVISTPTPGSPPIVIPSFTPTAQPIVHQTNIEVIADDATADSGWGGHQPRIVHTQDGIFASYIVEGQGEFAREWRLMERQIDGTWNILAHGNAGGGPVNLLASPDGTLHVIGWPNGVGTMWSGKPNHGTITMSPEKIPNVATGNYPYSSAGTDANGDLCILSSSGGEKPIGQFHWACYIASKKQWITQTNKLDYRYAYTYVFPGPNEQLSLVATRDVRWQALGYQQPPGTFDYVFNSFRYWQIKDVSVSQIQELSYADEPPTKKFSNVYLDAQMDAYLDTQDRMHILYWQMGATTSGYTVYKHRIISPSGDTLYDERIPQSAGHWSRIFQDKEQRFWLLGSDGYLYLMDKDGVKLDKRIKLDLGGYVVEYSGFDVSVPRTGTPLSNVMDVIFPSRGGTKWLYFQLEFKQ